MLLDPSMPPNVELEDVPCPNGCKPSDTTVLIGRDRLHHIPGNFSVVRCGCCGLMRTNPRPTPGTIGAYYPADYAPHKPTTSTTPKKQRHWRHRAKDRISQWLGRDVRRLPPVAPGHMLEIGCASGSYLLEMRQKGWTVEGIEYSDTAAEHARAQGIHVQTGSVESAQPPRQQADVVTAWMVLEHLHDPVHSLQKIRRWVKPGGYLVGVVPDAGAFDRKLFGEYWYALQLPTHLYHYERQSLARVLEMAGWQLIKTRWQPNERNLLNTLNLWLQEHDHPMLHRRLRWLKDARGGRKFRRWLGWGLGLSHQSGRVEFWARPNPQWQTNQQPSSVS